jgi:N-acetyl-gamma-glutamyl-phosphate reductase
MSAKIFIDGEAGTTGLQIRARLQDRSDVELIGLADADRKDAERRRQMLNGCDLAILCLPDQAAREAVALIENPDTRVIDASTAHRVAEGWVYGMPELVATQASRIAEAKRVSNPGCYAIAAVALLQPLVAAGLVPADWPLTINAISGYSGGGKSLISKFENPAAPDHTEAPFFLYGLGLEHKHVPEIERWSGLSCRPLFVPSVGRYAQGMIVQVPLQLWSLPGKPSAAQLHAVLCDHYAGQRFLRVAPLEAMSAADQLEPESLNGSNELRLHVFANELYDQAVLAGLLDNLGKGASGQAVQNLNIMLGLPEETGLETAFQMPGQLAGEA